MATSEWTPSAAELSAELRRALAEEELIAFFQPQVDLRSGRVVAVEALCRWNHPQYGVLMPDRFIQEAERSGYIARLDRLMLEEAARRAVEWHGRGIEVSFAVNVSPTELHPEFADSTLEHLQELHLPPRAVTVEITESPALQESCEEYRTLQTLLEGGVGVAVDDFGAGHTTLESLRRLPLSEIKIDRSLMLDQRPEADSLVAECIGIAHERAAIVVAEGVETDEHLARAVRWGCDRAQGFYFAPALSAEEIEPLLVVA
ncbi:EAL domain-containing protein [Agromyces salentinus]|uniref:EAL domain-containing protein n=1 Tax=Agromyces salentinus TaxID=269421 RepID=A0ABN2MTT4_9MICO|nr:EAL domain-containing protein [Agromyces salentinus]